MKHFCLAIFSAFSMLFVGSVFAAHKDGHPDQNDVADWKSSKAVEVFVASEAGGGSDEIARFISSIVEKERLADQPLVVLNKPGNSGAEALMHLANANDPNHTIMVNFDPFFTTPLTQPDLGLDIQDFTPIGRMAEDTLLLWVNKDDKIQQFQQFLDEAGKSGTSWAMGGSEVAQADAAITGYLNDKFDLSVEFIPYTGDDSIVEDLAEKQVRSLFLNPSTAMKYYKSGDFVPLVSFSDERLPMFPDTPTIKEVGGEISYTRPSLVVGAPGMSSAALTYYTNLFSDIFESSEWQNYKTTNSLWGDFIGGSELRSYWRTQQSDNDGVAKLNVR